MLNHPFHKTNILQVDLTIKISYPINIVLAMIADSTSKTFVGKKSRFGQVSGIGIEKNLRLLYCISDSLFDLF